jgi:rhomboid-like protein
MFNFNQLPPGLRNIVILIALMGMAQIALPRIDFDVNQLYLFYPDSSMFRPWQLVTHIFAHGNIMHFLFNVIALVSFGAIIEYRLKTKRFLMLYFISGMGSVLLHFLSVAYDAWSITGSVLPQIQGVISGDFSAGFTSPQGTVHYGPMLGASGAIYGIMVAFAFFYPNEEMIFMFIPYPIKAKYLVPVIVGIDVVFGFSNIEGNPVAHFAHIGGALAGFVTVYVWNRLDCNKHWINN